MSTYLVIKNGSTTKSYLCKSTYTGLPYLKVDTAYMDLTTNLTKTGLRTKIDNVVYMPASYTTTVTSRVDYTETTGYSGNSSCESTSGYSGYIGSSSSSSYYYGTVSSVNVATATAYKTWGGHATRTATWSKSSSTKLVGQTEKDYSYRGSCSITVTYNGYTVNLNNSKQNLTSATITSVTSYVNSSYSKSISGNPGSTLSYVSTGSDYYYGYPYPSATYYITLNLYTQLKAWLSDTLSAVNVNFNTTLHNIANSTSVVTQSYTATTSSVPGSMVSTTALTRSSSYTTTSTTSAGSVTNALTRATSSSLISTISVD